MMNLLGIHENRNGILFYTSSNFHQLDSYNPKADVKEDVDYFKNIFIGSLWKYF